MPIHPESCRWWQLTPVQRAMLRRLWRDGPLLAPNPWEMRTVRSLAQRGLLRSRGRADAAGTWFLTARALRLIEGAAPAREA
ncbi:hypothetical protein Q8W71_15330 [Methylobacterium sp. NEAU 140]|uniref:hypothetical protein n=1 Tax=Methylobacterium sp. NEAU 140 TaxID=3064945 RepID=UPI00273484E4|nr:hypothetical protein [Methylobacterium sp. NEAU 140]MDP4024002.1 hypothetical protein [Methylobacterium sp. NEAU 140]